MGRKVKWYSAMKKALSAQAKEKNKNNQESAENSGKNLLRKKKQSACLIKIPVKTATTKSTNLPPIVPPSVVPPPSEPAKLSSVDKVQTKHAYAVAKATVKAAEAVVPATQADVPAAKAAVPVVQATIPAAKATTEVVRLTATASSFGGKSKEEIAAIKIQTAFRGYMGRRTLRALRELLRLKTEMQGKAIKHQTANILKSMQALARVQTQVHERRQKLAEDNLARQKLVQQKYAREKAEVKKSQVST